VTIVSLALFWLFLSAVGNLFVSKSFQSASGFPPASPAAKFATAVSSSTFILLVIFYGVTALVAAIATWRMRSWMPIAFLVWSFAALLLGVFFLLLIPTELFWGGKPAAAAFVLGLAVFLWLMYRYVRRVAYAASNAAT
jgi:Ca2+/Na+ antiporter